MLLGHPRSPVGSTCPAWFPITAGSSWFLVGMHWSGEVSPSLGACGGGSWEIPSPIFHAFVTQHTGRTVIEWLLVSEDFLLLATLTKLTQGQVPSK